MKYLSKLTASILVLAGLMGASSAWALHHEPPMAGVDDAAAVGSETDGSLYEVHFSQEDLANQW